jgi:NADH pyrophosphatase NudC (nudix superfamily)
MSLKDTTEKLGYNEEDRAFHERDAAWIAAKRKELDAARAKQLADEDRKTHFMKCPKCGQNLAETEFHGIKVDLCGSCGGMWFDKGEFEILFATRPKGFLQKFIGG